MLGIQRGGETWKVQKMTPVHDPKHVCIKFLSVHCWLRNPGRGLLVEDSWLLGCGLLGEDSWLSEVFWLLILDRRFLAEDCEDSG